ncbi:MAG: 6,7-dimethyl-8-ribityllumazine synthase [Thaumarchaeota archaeon]|nr:6,7-dimethyl-8-ribityllumazine synthase [Nitrososphaerota archaeon]MBT4510576.1 6,7-dimethyl-8-ribityllumazine synthase [Nitrososphaerota archaeon]MBT7359687.1 6,7-dimethyl-8-ribityllumazine synthase [Nitrososphaerota archaeon]MBT7824603.1 6,7-dimethyl-8-ribityllumazine synthase [Nitrososphaerota archaeon]
MKIAIVVAEFNQKITSRMYDVALETAKKLNVDVVHTSNVTGIFDMPLIIDKLLQRKDIDAVVTLGAVVKGQTKHDEVIAHSTARNIAKLSIKYQKPVSLGISGPGMAERQAYARIRPVSENAVNAVVKVYNEIKEIEK